MLFDPERRWAPQGICRPEDIKLYFADGGPTNRPPGKTVQAKWDQAKEICGMCPVKAQCARDTLGEPYGVWGGLDQYERYRTRTALASAVKRWPRERQLAWGKELLRLREGGLIWRDIQTMTGLTESPAGFLIREWQRHLEEHPPQPAAEVIDLPLPGDKRPFPTKVGRRNCWVRNVRIILDAYYRGQTADGLWIQVQVSERGNRNKWFKQEDVHMYHPQPVVVMNFVGRPDASAA